MDFIELKVNVQASFADILIAELAEIGYESFVETEDGVDAYVQAMLFNESRIQEIVQKYQPQTAIVYSYNTSERKNWNEEWEKNYQPIRIKDLCLVRASFHPADASFPYEIIINPKMSFGTGHHETTAQMLESQLEIPHQGKQVLDVGCGTGILSVMASKLNAAIVDAFDIDDWAVENAIENAQLNNCPNVHVQKGTIQEVKLASAYDIILANINRNVLLNEIPKYAALLPGQGWLLVSGFYEKDLEDIEKIAAQNSLKKVRQKVKNQWMAVVFQK